MPARIRKALIAAALGLIALGAVLVFIGRDTSTHAVGPAFPESWDQEPFDFVEGDLERPRSRRTWLIRRDAELPAGFALILEPALTGLDRAVVVTDPAALSDAQGHAFVEHRHMDTGSSIFVAVISLGQALAKVSTLAHMGWDGEIVASFRCWWCAHDDKDALPRDLADLVSHGRALSYETHEFTDEAAWQSAVAAARAAPGSWVHRALTYWREAAQDSPASGQLALWRVEDDT